MSSYVPKSLSAKDAARQRRALRKSRDAYKRKTFVSRPHLSSFKSKPSPHVKKVEETYHKPLAAMLKIKSVPGCHQGFVPAILAKGEGAYYSSGSRPNQSAVNWANARLASTITGGKACNVDHKEIQHFCSKHSKAFRMCKERFPNTFAAKR